MHLTVPQRLMTCVSVVALSASLACSMSDLSGPVETKRMTPGSLAFSQPSEDYCRFFWFAWACHENDLSYQSADSYYVCDSGCHSYPLDPTLKNEMIAAMNTFSSNCPSWVRTYLNYQLFHNNIRYYDTTDGNYADTHLSDGRYFGDGQGADYYANIHVQRPLAMADRHEFADTMAHEAFHGYTNSNDESAAATLAAQCAP